MAAVITKPDTHQKLQILSNDAQYDLACACGSTKDEHRKRTAGGKWIYPITLPNGGKSTLFKTLISNICTNDCKYCPLRADSDPRRCSLTPEETARVFMDYYNRREVFGLFLTSGVIGTPDHTMTQLIDTAQILRRKHNFRGYIHLKAIPGASPAAIEKAVSLASAVSLNIETPGQKYLTALSTKKDYIRDIIAPLKLISRLTAPGQRYSRVKQTTQFIVGASDESDADIIRYTQRLYDNLRLQRVYFSSYQPGLGDRSLPGEKFQLENTYDPLTREHRLYQVDFLLRKYGFQACEIPLDAKGRLSLATDPKHAWALANPQYFPVNINTADKEQLLRVPGLGPITVARILKRRRYRKLRRLADISKPTKTLQKASSFITF